MDDDDIKQMTRRHVAEFLPDALRRALESYHAFMRDRQMPDEPGDFSKHHNAAKAAISHIQLLLKLAQWAELPEATENNSANGDSETAKTIQDARQEIQGNAGSQERWEIEGEEDI